MNEKLLHFIWKYRLFNQDTLITTEGEKIELIKPGTHNTDAGPDFQNARVKIGKTLWAGNVELHINSADWFNHRHQNDEAYKNVILHVVYKKEGKVALRQDGASIPTLELYDRINPGTLSRYEELEKNKHWVPCENFLPDVDDFKLRTFLERLMIERLQGKVEQINQLLTESENDWENVMFQMIARYLGAGVNQEPFLLLAKSLPVKIWAKYQHDNLQTEALVFGQAGMLGADFDDEYPTQLKKEYNYLKRLHSLQPLQKHLWKFLRMRPSNFPTVRLAQLAALMHKEVKLFSSIKKAENAKAIFRFFDTGVSEYWETHYQFDKPSKKVNSHLGAAMKNILLINAVAPVLFAYGKHKDEESYCDKALKLLEKCAAEDNAIIRGWDKLGIKASNAGETQSLLQLKKGYCDKFRCLDCAIGHSVLK